MRDYHYKSICKAILIRRALDKGISWNKIAEHYHCSMRTIKNAKVNKPFHADNRYFNYEKLKGWLKSDGFSEKEIRTLRFIIFDGWASYNPITEEWEQKIVRKINL